MRTMVYGGRGMLAGHAQTPLKAKLAVTVNVVWGMMTALALPVAVRIGRTSCVFQPVRDTAKSDKGASIKSLEG